MYGTTPWDELAGADPETGEATPGPRIHYEDVDIAIVCESTYPYLKGGLSAVVHQICEGSPHLRIGIIHITWDSDSPSVPLYDVPDNVAWVMPVYQSMAEHDDTFRAYTAGDLGKGRRHRRALVDRFFDAIHAHLDGDDEPLWQLYDEGINPRTRQFALWPLLSTKAFMNRAVREFGGSEVPLTDLFWWLRDFASLAYAVVSPDFPHATVYHAHTTGAAGLLAAAAARQNGTSFLLTEHNLYTRDTINHLLDRSMEHTVSVSDWRTLDEYVALDGDTRRVEARQRYWMQWFTRLGVIAYRAADRVTYLYPEAITEAADLQAIPAKSIVVPNGLEPLPFAAARERFSSRTQDRRRGDHTWRFAYIARIVPIKGLLDLLDSLSLIRAWGIDDWTLDVMGPDGEQPRYVARCRARVDELGLQDHVRFRGTVNLAAELGEADLLLMPSHNEGVPIAILEVMAVGQPILATDVGGIREVVTAPLLDSSDVELQACGVVLPPRDVRAMAEAIELLISDHDLFEEYARNATARLDRLYHIDVTLAQYNELYAGFGVTSTPRSRALTPALREVRAAVGTTASQGTTSTAGTAIASTNPGHEPSHLGRGRHARRQRRHGLRRDQRQEAVPTR